MAPALVKLAGAVFVWFADLVRAAIDILGVMTGELMGSVHETIMSTLGLVEGIVETWVSVTTTPGPPAMTVYEPTSAGEELITAVNGLVNKLMVLAAGVGFAAPVP